MLKDNLKIEFEVQEVEESGLVADWAFIVSINKYYGYIDIYYLKYRDCKTCISQASLVLKPESPAFRCGEYVKEVNVSDE